jgi:hypothetical protein
MQPPPLFHHTGSERDMTERKDSTYFIWGRERARLTGRCSPSCPPSPKSTSTRQSRKFYNKNKYCAEFRRRAGTGEPCLSATDGLPLCILLERWRPELGSANTLIRHLTRPVSGAPVRQRDRGGRTSVSRGTAPVAMASVEQSTLALTPTSGSAHGASHFIVAVAGSRTHMHAAGKASITKK